MSDKTSFYPELARDIAAAGRLGVLLPGLARSRRRSSRAST
jgi:hypothetical protein